MRPASIWRRPHLEIQYIHRKFDAHIVHNMGSGLEKKSMLGHPPHADVARFLACSMLIKGSNISEGIITHKVRACEALEPSLCLYGRSSL